MVSFLDKLKVKVEEGGQSPQEDASMEAEKERKSAGFLQLEVDIFQTSSEIIIVAPIPGVEVKDLDISIENENDIVTIQGKKEMPEVENVEDKDRKFLRQECQWGNFYRQIILPQEVNVSEVEAKFKKGILILRLPILRLQTKGKKKIVVDTDK